MAGTGRPWRPSRDHHPRVRGRRRSARVGPGDVPRVDRELRDSALSGLPPSPRPVIPSARAGGEPLPGITDTRHWSDQEIWNSLEAVKHDHLGWDETTESARKWWLAFEAQNQHRPALVFRLAEELKNRHATITEFFLAFVYSNTDNIQANLHYLDYSRLKKQQEARKPEGDHDG